MLIFGQFGHVLSSRWCQGVNSGSDSVSFRSENISEHFPNEKTTNSRRDRWILGKIKQFWAEKYSFLDNLGIFSDLGGARG